MEKRLRIAKRSVIEAGQLIMGIRRSGLTQILKADNSPVTNADEASEAHIRQTLLEAFPDDGFIGEEFPETPSKNGYTWACDPIDGTWSFINLESTFTISLALMQGEIPVLAIIFNPLTGELYEGATGLETKFNDLKLPFIEKSNLKESVVNFFIHRSRLEEVAILYDLRNEKKIGKLVSQGGSLAAGLAQISRGSNNVFIGLSSKQSNIWDMAAGIYLIRSIGGKITTLNGDALGMTLSPFKTMIASTNASIHEDALSVLREAGFPE